MKTTLYFALWLFFSVSLQAQHKYGFLAGSDDALLAKARDPEIDAVVLGCVYKIVAPSDRISKANMSYVTVIESYKGPLVVGQKIVVVIYAEEVPKKEQELGTLRFYFLRRKTSDEIRIPDRIFTCEWTDAARYDEYGEPMRKFLRQRLR